MNGPAIPVSFKQRILLGFSILILLFLGVMIAVEVAGIPGTAYKGKTARYRASILSDMELVSGLLSHHISNWYGERRVDVDGLASSPFLRQTLETISPQADGQLRRELDAFRTSHPGFQSIALLDPATAAIRAANGAANDVRSSADLGIDAARFAKLIIPGYQETVDIHHVPGQSAHLRIIRQMGSPEAPDKLIAVLVAECDIEVALRTLIGSVSSLLARNCECVIASRIDGRVTRFQDHHADDGHPGVFIADVSAFTPVLLAISGIDGPYDGPDPLGNPILAFHRHIKFDQGIALALVLQIDRALALQPAREDLLRQCLLWLAMFLAGLGMCFFLSKQISRPVNELAAVARRVESGDLTGRVTAPDGSEIGRFAAVFNDMVARLQATHQDLETQVLERTRELGVLSARQEAILTAAPDIIVEVDKNKIYTWSNRAGVEFFGEDMLGQPAESYFAENQDTYQLIQPMFEGTGEAFYVESWQWRKDGTARLLAWWCSALKDQLGQVTSVISTARDITESKRAEETLKQKLVELERFNQVTIGRELRMIELKKEINVLLTSAGEPPKYRIVTDLEPPR